MSKPTKLKRYDLRDSPLFRLRSRKKLAALLFVSQNDLKKLTANKCPYTRLWKHKKLKSGPDAWRRESPPTEIKGLYRPIDNPDPRLKNIQTRIAKLLGRINPPDWLFSPVKGRSYVNNAARHKDSEAFWLLDIADYFGSCTANNVAHFFGKKLKCSPDVTAILVRLVTHEKSLPQGSPSSPILAYFSNLNMWREIEQKVVAAGLLHSVYADDISISGQKISKAFIWDIKKSVHKHGLSLSSKKECSIINGPAEITGVIVQGGRTKLPNRQWKRLFELRDERQNAQSDDERKMFDSQITGRIAQQRQVEKS